MPTKNYEVCGEPKAPGGAPCVRIKGHRGDFHTDDEATAEHLDVADPDGPQRPTAPEP